MIFAIEAHNSTNHLYDGKPYSIHLSMVHSIAINYINDIIPDFLQDEVLSACWLHDTIEDCRLTYNDLKKEFGENIAEIVYAVSNEKGKLRKERANDIYYSKIRNTPGATFVKMCDRLANIKYSKVTNSRRLDVYRNEHKEFISILINQQALSYRNIIEEMEYLLS